MPRRSELAQLQEQCRSVIDWLAKADAPLRDRLACALLQPGVDSGLLVGSETLSRLRDDDPWLDGLTDAEVRSCARELVDLCWLALETCLTHA